MACENAHVKLPYSNFNIVVGGTLQRIRKRGKVHNVKSGLSALSLFRAGIHGGGMGGRLSISKEEA